MSGSRERILAVLAETLGRNPPADAPVQRLRPARSLGDPAALAARFVAMAAFAGAEVLRVARAGEVPGAVSAILSRNGLGDEFVIAPDGLLATLPWRDRPRLVMHRRAPLASDRVAVTAALCGVAETGSLLVRSAPGLANTLHFLPEAHIVVLRAADIVGGYEDGWALLRAEGGGNAPPRAATFITGPSRTADIEKTPQIGVHGPKSVHIILIDGEETP